MTINLIVGGMPRGGTTVAAKFLSLHKDMFCYAGETHLLPFMHSMFGQFPCREDKIDFVTGFLRKQFMSTMVEMPRYSVSKGAHPANLIFAEKDVENLIEGVCSNLKAQLCGIDLYNASLNLLRELLSKTDPRKILGEKTPNNIFAMGDYAPLTAVKNIVVMREPVGVLRSMKSRVNDGDVYSSAFKGDLEKNLGIYLEYAMAAKSVLDSSENNNLIVRYEDMAENPASVILDMFGLFNRKPENRVLDFVEGIWDAEVANRAPMNYKQLNVRTGYDELTPPDIWKIFSLTCELRKTFGYSDEQMEEYGFDIPKEWPNMEIPEKIIPLYGFREVGWSHDLCMKRRGALIAYLGNKRSYDVKLSFKSNFPEQVQSDVKLNISVNGIQREIIEVKPGKQTISVNLNLKSNNLTPMGNKGGYAIIHFISSAVYSRIAHFHKGDDPHESSFTLSKCSIDRKRFKFW